MPSSKELKQIRNTFYNRIKGCIANNILFLNTLSYDHVATLSAFDRLLTGNILPVFRTGLKKYSIC